MKVYKYRKVDDKIVFERDLNSILNNQFYASNLEHLNDEFEANYDEDISKMFSHYDIFENDILSSMSKRLEELRNSINQAGIFSTSKSPYLNTMWTHYANKKGYCIEYDFERIIDKSRNTNFFKNIEVDYQNEKPILSFGDVYDNATDVGIVKMLGTKTMDWSYEQEIRLIFDTPGLKSHHDSAITAIYFGTEATQETINIFKESLTNRNIKLFKMIRDKSLHQLRGILEYEVTKKNKYDISKFRFKCVKTDENPVLSTKYLLIEDEYNKKDLRKLGLGFIEQYCFKPTNIYFINDSIRLNLLSKYPKTDKEYILFAEAVIAEMPIGCNNEIYCYPFKDYRYKQIMKNNKTI